MKPPLIALCLTLVLGLVACAPADDPREPQNSATRVPTATESMSGPSPQALPTPTTHTLTITDVKTMLYPVDGPVKEGDESEPVFIKPPNAIDVFEIDTSHLIPSGGTRYLAAHAVGPTFDGPPGPGNLWADLKTGDRVVVDGQTYRVTTVEETPKAWSDDLDTRFKEPVPGRLLLITCIPLEQGGTAVSNRIIWTEAE